LRVASFLVLLRVGPAVLHPEWDAELPEVNWSDVRRSALEHTGHVSLVAGEEGDLTKWFKARPQRLGKQALTFSPEPAILA
jgi:hypothetical protein